jgi:hypothetical protein
MSIICMLQRLFIAQFRIVRQWLCIVSYVIRLTADMPMAEQWPPRGPINLDLPHVEGGGEGTVTFISILTDLMAPNESDLMRN